MKIGRNDSCPCGSGKKYKKCCLENDSAKNSLTGGDLPIYQCWISRPAGSKIVVISRLKLNGNFEIASMLVDEWKMGLKDGFGNYNLTKNQLDDYIRMPEFREADVDECHRLIKKGICIASELGFRLPREYEQFKGIIGDIENIDLTGSLYKCYACGKEDLDEKTICKIKSITLKDVKEGVCGTPNETMVYFVCNKCRNKRSSLR